MESLMDQIRIIGDMASGVMEAMLHEEENGNTFSREYAILASQYNTLAKAKENLTRLLIRVKRTKKESPLLAQRRPDREDA